MYRDHVAILNAGIRHDPDIFCKAVTFAVLSMRQTFVSAVQSMKTFTGMTDRHLWGFKRGAYDFTRKNKFCLWERAKAAQSSESGLEVLTEIPGLGIVKAAFVLQMMGHDIGCLDSRNVQRLSLNPREWRTDGPARKQSPAFKRKIQRYVDFTAGRAEELWNDWCEDAARVYHVSADEISRDHLVILSGKRRSEFGEFLPVPLIGKTETPF
jgi:hypothetical protein